MKKKLLATLLLSTIALSNAATVTTVYAEDTDSKISAVEGQISSLTEKQAAAQAKVDEVQATVNAIESEQATLTAENEKLQEESSKLVEEIAKLSEAIVARNEALTAQARSAQTDGTATSYINTILDSNSISDAVSRVTAMNEIVSANNQMLEQQEADKAAVEEKQKANQEAINTIAANQQKLSQDAQALNTHKAELEAAKLNLAAELATAEGEKGKLLEEKAAAEAAAAKAAEEQAAAEAAHAEQVRILSNSAANATTEVVDATTETPDGATSGASTNAVAPTTVAPANTPAAPTASSANKVQYSAANTYPVGQCTWGVKALAPWVGNYWGNAKDWIASAQAAGYSVGTQPTVGSVAVWPGDGGGYGHVAVVTAVQSPSNIQVSESNYAGNMTIGNYRGWFNPAAGTWGGSVVYIYP